MNDSKAERKPKIEFRIGAEIKGDLVAIFGQEGFSRIGSSGFYRFEFVDSNTIVTSSSVPKIFLEQLVYKNIIGDSGFDLPYLLDFPDSISTQRYVCCLKMGTFFSQPNDQGYDYLDLFVGTTSEIDSAHAVRQDRKIEEILFEAKSRR